MARKVKGEQNKMGESSRDITVNLHKQIHKVQFKKKAPRAIREIKAIAAKQMLTSDVRIDTPLNKFIWSKGVRNIPTRVRVRLIRRKNEEEENKGQEYYTLVQHVPETDFHGKRAEASKVE
ncbi:Ribosomal protein L31e domain [Pseudocohnilembus persalinus]|uniref:Ribosomal protein L31e domain n=1 Tax=Pseudocohnilembus persalinus TaxID=266149 RepID=A0A0V0R7U6_PSEPJ|nr:Ribosomal protein L31e domain [Pseudocohnilembus persalinus]|eukprot:KRX10561.1 Ribosomal protein L31e domain [Pseudocohnilembus persalinus]